MKTIAKIKISQNLDFIILESDLKNNGSWGIVSRWDISGLDVGQTRIKMNEAKVSCFDEIWKLTEMGYKVELIPYIN